MTAMLEWIEGHPGLASWVQAIGTVSAVFVAMLLPIWDRRRTERAAVLALRPAMTDAAMAFAGMALEPHSELARRVRLGALDRLNPRLSVHVARLAELLSGLPDQHVSEETRALDGPPTFSGLDDMMTQKLVGLAAESLGAARKVDHRIVEQHIVALVSSRARKLTSKSEDA